ncbi:MAG TPA: ATP-binding protein [Polyangia bacterium]|jgi:signal transduction histidine kinase
MSTPAEVVIPAPEETWRRETLRFVRFIFRARFMLAPLLAIVFTAYLVWDRVAWKLLWIAGTWTVMVGVAVSEHLRLRRGRMTRGTLAYNLAVMLLVQTAMIYVTGGIESPLIILYVPLGTISGLVLALPRRALAVLLIPITFTILFAAGALHDWIPRATPSFFGLGPGFAHNPVYVWLKAGFIILLVTLTALVGTVMRRTYEKVVRDVAEARRETLDTLASRNREILSVASTVAHELKNPLSSIQGLAQLLARGAAPGGKDRERLDVMLREIGRMGTVLDEFRDFSRPLSGLSLGRADLGRLIQDVVQLSEGNAGASRVAAAPAAALAITCDPHKVKQALLNLVQNGLDAVAAGGAVEIRTTARAGGWVDIAVLDDGAGLAPQVAGRLFTPGVTTKERGSGLGLVVARSIAEQHGGRLTLAGRPEGGCVATLTLPLVAEPSPLEIAS